MEQIKAGDLVMVVRACGCPDSGKWIGHVFKVQSTVYGRCVCNLCGRSHGFVDGVVRDDLGRYPTKFVKKIDGLSDPEEAQTKVEREIKKRSPVKA